ncbi:ATP-grasp ribosomal peptide maturase [Streptomyces sp. NPDC002851]
MVAADGTVLVVTNRSDATCDPVIEELTRRGIEVVRFDTADFPTASRLVAALTGRGWAGRPAVGSRTVDLEAVRSVWWRRPGEMRTPGSWPTDARAFAASEARSGLLGVLSPLPVRWINHPSRNAAANYKPHQLAAAARCGLDTPRTVITNDPAYAREFIGTSEVIYKALGGSVDRGEGFRGVIPTTVVTADQVDDSVSGTATMFQEYVEKAYEVRLTVMGKHLFPVAIHAESHAARLDRRTDYGALSYAPVSLPDEVEAGVRRLMNELGLFFGAFDLAVTPGGAWKFFEVNANGQWHWLTRHIDLPLIETMADALQEGD